VVPVTVAVDRMAVPFDVLQQELMIAGAD